ncbi:hypothetical protein WMY93_034013, partial [Mugilogobius chulae]
MFMLLCVTSSLKVGKTLDNTHCTTAVTGSELLMVHQSPPAEVLIQCYYVVKMQSLTSTSKYSEKKSIKVHTFVVTTPLSLQTPPSVSTSPPHTTTSQSRVQVTAAPSS